MAPALIVVSFVVFVGLMVVLAFKHAKKSQENFNQLTSRLGFTSEPQKKVLGIVYSGPAASGQIRGRVARLFAYTTGSGKSRIHWCALSIAPSEHGNLTFQLTLQGLGSRILQVFGSREIAVGDSAFDARWFIQTNQPEFLQAALIPELRERLTHALDDVGNTRRPSLKLESGSLIYSEKGNFASDDCCSRIFALKDVMSDFSDIAEVFAQQFRSPR